MRACVIPNYDWTNLRKRPQSFFTHSRLLLNSPVLARFDHVASRIVNVNNSIVSSAVEVCISDCIRDGISSAYDAENNKGTRLNRRIPILYIDIPR